MNQRFAAMLTIVFGLSLVLNLVSLNRLTGVQNQVSRLSQAQQESERNIRHHIDRIHLSISELERAQRWITALEWSLTTDSPDSCVAPIALTADWSLRELQADQQVSLEIRQVGSTWQTVEIQAIGELAYRANLQVEPQPNWEYRVVAKGPAGIRASEPAKIHLLEQLFFRAVDLMPGDTWSYGTEQRIRYLIENNVQGQGNFCSRVTAAELMVSYAGQVTVYKMYQGKRNPGPPPEFPGSTGGASWGSYTVHGRTDSWWSDWLNIPSGAKVQANVTFGDETTATLDLDRMY